MWDKMETPAIVYDLDTSGGLMEQIQTLLAPPKSEEGEKRIRKPDKDARRSGRATNHDTCDSCREGGDLLCCDHCPAAFHLQCCDPPLSAEMLPPGEWMCHRCMVRRKKREQKEQVNGLLERKQQQSPAAELELGAVRLDGGVGPGAGGLRVAVAQVRLLERRTSSRPGTPTSNASTDTPTPSEQNDVDEDLLDVEDEAPGSEPESTVQQEQHRLKRPFELLIAAAMERNPTQFQLPSDLTCTTALPGTSKRRRKEETTGKNVKRPQHELDHNGLVPLPVKVCFTCSRSCRLAPLIQCDYCPLLFHMDCLDPPLTAMPTGKWMCPNHSEHIVLNQRNLTLSNRCQLFDQFQDRMSQHAVKVDFLQRVHRQNAPNRRGVRADRVKTLKVPNAIKSQYQCPPPIMAPAGIRNGELICTGVPDPPHQRPPPQHFTTEAEQQEWLRDVIALQCSIVRHLSAKQMPSTYWDSEPEQTEKADIKPCVAAVENSALCPSDRTLLPDPFPSLPCSTPVGPQGAPALQKSLGPSQERGSCSSCMGRPCQNCRTTNGLLEQLAKTNGPAPHDASPEPCPRLQAELQHRLGASGLTNHTGAAMVKTENPATLDPCANSSDPPGLPPQPHRTGPGIGTAGGQAAALTSRSVSSPAAGTRALTPPRAPQDTGTARLACQTPPSDGKVSLRAVSPSSGSVSSTMGDLSPCMKALIEGGEGEIELSKLDEKFIKLLAWQRIQQLFPPKAAATPSHRTSPPPSTSSPTPHAPHTEAQREEVQARAVFYPLMGKGGAVNMCYRSLYIGSGADMDVCLTNYGHCNYVSGKHACIFYDENTKHYELLNYSEHGTTVDNVLYSCDFSEKSSPSSYSSVVSKVQNIIRRCKKRKQQQEDGAEPETREGPAGGVMSCQSQGGGAQSPCGCKASSSSLVGGSGAGWEGTALLHHGSYIKLGCLQFVFSIAEFASKQPKEEKAELSEKPQPLNDHQVRVLQPNSVP